MHMHTLVHLSLFLSLSSSLSIYIYICIISSQHPKQWVWIIFFIEFMRNII